MTVIETKNLSYRYGVGTPFEKTAVKQTGIPLNVEECVGMFKRMLGEGDAYEA